MEEKRQRWSASWSKIISGENDMWKVTEEFKHKQALAYFQQYVKGDPKDVSVLCPLAGDDPIVHLLWKQGYTVTTIDLVPEAVERMKSQFSNDWTKVEDTANNTIVWKHGSGRANLIIGDALQYRSELENTFDAVYDKDSFGALEREMRSEFCSRMAEYVKKDGIVYLECKLKANHENVKDQGPPFSLKEEDLMEESSYGKGFNYVAGLGKIYDIDFPGWEQTGHILKLKE